MRKIYDALLNFIFPPRCPNCASYTENAGEWCAACLKKCVSVRREPLTPEIFSALDAVYAVSAYEGTQGKLIRKLKFSGDKSALPYLKTFLHSGRGNLPKELFTVDFVTAVPLHVEREKLRGFNQSELIFEGFFDKDIARLLVRRKNTRPQYELHADERRTNLKGAFALAEGADVKDKSVLIVDDIVTTGTTLYECALVLKSAGAKRVYALALTGG